MEEVPPKAIAGHRLQEVVDDLTESGEVSPLLLIGGSLHRITQEAILVENIHQGFAGVHLHVVFPNLYVKKNPTIVNTYPQIVNYQNFNFFYLKEHQNICSSMCM